MHAISLAPTADTAGRNKWNHADAKTLDLPMPFVYIHGQACDCESCWCPAGCPFCSFTARCHTSKKVDLNTFHEKNLFFHVKLTLMLQDLIDKFPGAYHSCSGVGVRQQRTSNPQFFSLPPSNLYLKKLLKLVVFFEKSVQFKHDGALTWCFT